MNTQSQPQTPLQQDSSPELNSAISLFIEQLGLNAQADGLPRIAGRMMGYLLVDGQARSLSSLADELQVSRGSISTNARLLASQGMIERVAVAGERQDYYQIVDEPYKAMLLVYAERMRQMSRNASALIEALEGESGYSSTVGRVKQVEQFFRIGGGHIEPVLETMAQENQSSESSGGQKR
jgi:DNA-binding transcriptional regulator GbsR (MarR family)